MPIFRSSRSLHVRGFWREPRWAHPPANLHRDVELEAAPAIRRPLPGEYPSRICQRQPVRHRVMRHQYQMSPVALMQQNRSDKRLTPPVERASHFQRPVRAANLPRPSIPPTRSGMHSFGSRTKWVVFPAGFASIRTERNRMPLLHGGQCVPPLSHFRGGHSPDKLLRSGWGGSDPSTTGNARRKPSGRIAEHISSLGEAMASPQFYSWNQVVKRSAGPSEDIEGIASTRGSSTKLPPAGFTGLSTEACNPRSCHRAMSS